MKSIAIILFGIIAALLVFGTAVFALGAVNDVEELGDKPSGGPVKMWLAGVGLALFPIVYGGHCLFIYGRRSYNLDLEGSAALALAIAYMRGRRIHSLPFFLGIAPVSSAL